MMYLVPSFYLCSGPSRLGLWMSLTGVASCTARVTAALWLTAAYRAWGLACVYAILSAAFLLSIVLIIVNFEHIKPMERTESIDIQYSKLDDE